MPTEDPYAALFRPEPEPVPEPELDLEPAPVPATGRLFRSVGASAVEGAVPAISASQAGKLRSMVPASAPTPPPVVIAPAAAVASVVTIDGPSEVAVKARGGGALTGMGVYAVVIGVTVAVAFVNVLFFGPDINAITGVALAMVSVIAALLVRRADDVTAIIAPPLAFGLAAVTAAQIGLTTTTFANRFITAFFTLGNNWYWIIGSTLAAMAIVAVRRRKS
ncbi:MAG: hypothetical protein NWR45_00625 [Candidatus Nanopelagicales bacterium]|nr:hypothetical protein [Candidatus Nanopelagicales bacterium]